MKSTLINKIGIILLASLFLSSSLFAKNKNKETKEEQTKSRNFIAFDDAVYNTSPDKRIGAKILVDTNIVGPSIAAMTHLTYLPGAHIPSHRHVYVTEIIYVLEGNLTIRIGTETKILGKDSTAFIPPKTFHEITNDSADVVKFLQYYSPSGAEEEYRNWENPKTIESKAQAEEIEKKLEEKNRGPEEIQGPAPLVVPGSPVKVKLGEVKIGKEENENTNKSDKKEMLLNLKPKPSNE
jgi:quercetin dioxygenase-like cupin family protein